MMGGGPVAVLRLASGEQILCILAESPGEWLFSHANNLASNCIDDCAPSEEEEGLEEFQASLQSLMSPSCVWVQCILQLVTLSSGRHAGLRAIGCGSNAKSRKRAGRLALAASAQARTCHNPSFVEDPTGDGAFGVLVAFAAQLFSGQSQGSGAAPPAAQTAQLLMAEPEDMPPPPPPGPPPVGVESAPPPPPPPLPEASAAGLKGKVATVTSNHPAVEGQGYLTLKRGDRIVLEYDPLEPGNAGDPYSEYAYGMNQRDGQTGWLPFALLHFD